MNDIAIPKTLTDVCSARDRVLAHLRDADALLEAAERELAQVSGCTLPYESKPRLSLERSRQEIDARLWWFAFDKTNFLLLMDAEAKRRFMDEVDKSAPPFTLENIRTTFLQLHQEADAMFVRGLVNVFRRLSREHRTNTHEPFKVNERAILPAMVSVRWRGGLEINYRSSDYLNDLDRVFKVLAGETHTPRALELAINTAFENGERFADAFYEARGFRNGNLHLKFNRLDLLERANRMIGDYFNGTALAADARRARHG